MYSRALNDATITIPSADLQNIVLSALGKGGVIPDVNLNPDGTLNTNSAGMGVSFGGFSLTNLALLGAVAYFLLRK